MQSFQNQEIIKYVKFSDFLNNTPEWQFLRKNMMIAIKEYGDGLQHLEDMTTIHINELLANIEAKGNEAFDPNPMIKRTIGKLMMTLTYGFDGDDGLERMAKVEENNNVDLLVETGPCMILNFCPPLRFFVPFVKNTYKELLFQMKAYSNIFQDMSDRRRKDFDENNPQVFIDHFFNLLGKPANIGTGMAKYKLSDSELWITHRNDANIAKICNLWTFWPVIQPIM